MSSAGKFPPSLLAERNIETQQNKGEEKGAIVKDFKEKEKLKVSCMQNRRTKGRKGGVENNY
jgi:hypothetical protein